MALSRFWTFILLLSIGYALVMLATGRQHSLGTLVNGNQGGDNGHHHPDTAFPKVIIGQEHLPALVCHQALEAEFKASVRTSQAMPMAMPAPGRKVPSI